MPVNDNPSDFTSLIVEMGKLGDHETQEKRCGSTFDTEEG